MININQLGNRSTRWNFLLIFIGFSPFIDAQSAKLSFSYDNSGNQTKSEYLENLKSEKSLSDYDLNSETLNQISVYPNLVKDILNFDIPFDADLSLTKTEIYNLNGSLIKRILNDEKSKKNQINMIDLDSNVYFLVFYLNNGTNISRKITKQ